MIYKSNEWYDSYFDVCPCVLDAVFCENSEPRSLANKQKRAKKTFEEMMKYIPGH